MSLAAGNVDQLTVDVEMAQVSRVLIDQMEEHPFEGGRFVATPARSGLTEFVEVVATNDQRRLSSACSKCVDK